MSQNKVKSKIAPQNSTFRQQLQRKIALTFVVKGYGLNAARYMLNEEVQNNMYNTYISSIIRTSLRKLCKIISRKLNQPIHEFTSRDQGFLRSPMANCRKWLSSDELNTLFKIIKIVYRLKEEQLFPNEVLKLYKKISDQLEYRQQYKNSELSMFYQPTATFHTPNPPHSSATLSSASVIIQKDQPSQLNPQNTITIDLNEQNMANSTAMKKVHYFQKQILSLFSKFGNVEKIILILRDKYKDSDCSYENICSVIEKVMKFGLKKIVEIYQKMRKMGKSLPFFQLPDLITAYILQDRTSYNFRMGLVKSLLELNAMNEERLKYVLKNIQLYTQKNKNLIELYKNRKAYSQNQL